MVVCSGRAASGISLEYGTLQPDRKVHLGRRAYRNIAGGMISFIIFVPPYSFQPGGSGLSSFRWHFISIREQGKVEEPYF
jgi:hypothetical protein